ncbi:MULTISPECIES: 8-oxoguanine DNA glycosylase [Pseudomonas]|uniref:8-oxoguanine DNA glycosylase n=1 Tax=Pseudomonas nitroreducens TaxID=46680 RepID=UPI001E2A61C7|nr:MULTISPECIES: 8-oxoguanine DNA glycosylase [Pseudomonas]MCE4071528.1 8-oxoguanine DNA glycosylase [Pseudomonas nitritireducens]MCE4081304.1 8-oxoguanine DNA glycosylase [Pseudomonas nitroreducens]
MQSGVVFVESHVYRREFPDANSEVLPGVAWGLIEAFPSPAYWAYQVWANEQEPEPINYRLGATLAEEVGACLLGGHGIPAHVGLAAFANLRELGVFDGAVPEVEQLLEWLSTPLKIGSRSVRYRFAKQKARYLHAALSALAVEEVPLHSGRALRDWLLSLPGIGYKTASWIARNWLDADDVAILDIHILRAGALAGFFSQGLTVDRHYLKLEEEFLALSSALGVRPSRLDALMWYQMMSANDIVHGLLNRSSKKAA